MITATLLTLLTLPLLTLAQGIAKVSFANYNFPTLFTGQTFILAWIGNGNPVNITLANGPVNNLQKVADIAIRNTAKTFTWTVPADLPTDNYVFQIAQRNGSRNRSPQFTIAGSVTRGIGPLLNTTAKFTPITPSVQPRTTTISTMSQAVLTTTQSGEAKAVPNGIPPMQIWVQDRAMQYDCEGLMATPTMVMTWTTETGTLVTVKPTATVTVVADDTARGTPIRASRTAAASASASTGANSSGRKSARALDTNSAGRPQFATAGTLLAFLLPAVLVLLGR